MSEEYEIEVIPVVVSEEPIELYKILKIENLVTSGSEAKNHIANGYVYVNGEVETRKRKKIMFGDIIGFDGEAYQVMSAEELASYDDADYAETADGEDYPEDEFVDPAALESDSVAAYMTEHDLSEEDFIADGSVTSTDVEADVAEATFIAPTPVVKPAAVKPVTDTWEQPEKKKKKTAAKQTQTAKAAEPKKSEKKKGRAAPFSF
ncbi:RNA-binding S4 domain-containing protein [Moritella marina ATCC 15381]|uniref:RNA-binding S4 domain-containing protein n=1 Tax=Moritella marina ATCC 15381 TaxID=1202962 RepID=A0A5J6WRU0_MORMI|nr:RNA-binding S4 domain-containing protein [Moritella marina]QFI39655.1 RNA-binding S4 domain-containing protein [Moritella marina ATCC 15381]